MGAGSPPAGWERLLEGETMGRLDRVRARGHAPVKPEQRDAWGHGCGGVDGRRCAATVAPEAQAPGPRVARAGPAQVRVQERAPESGPLAGADAEDGAARGVADAGDEAACGAMDAGAVADGAARGAGGGADGGGTTKGVGGTAGAPGGTGAAGLAPDGVPAGGEHGPIGKIEAGVLEDMKRSLAGLGDFDRGNEASSKTA
nr:WAG22 antigen-like [Setaria viridis]